MSQAPVLVSNRKPVDFQPCKSTVSPEVAIFVIDRFESRHSLIEGVEAREIFDVRSSTPPHYDKLAFKKEALLLQQLLNAKQSEAVVDGLI
ncbi:hypothetical protein D3C76_1495590 [compost metagenome]